MLLLALTLLGASLSACGNDVGDSSGLLRRVDADGIQSQQLYFVRDVSAAPLTADQLATLDADLAATAVPIRVELIENIAVAWFAPGGEAVIGRDTLVAAWDVVDLSDAEVQSGELRPGQIGGISPNTPAGNVDLDEVTVDYSVGQTGDLEIPAATIIIDFFDRLGSAEDLRIIQMINRAHPGCA
ncbi:MAG: hypothetical protein K8H88_29770 [Sandaracinaceae bacterium]|nr:hypothetical protein [Sandaracinaceae bacterium]